MARRTVLLRVMIAAVLLACVASLGLALSVSRKAEAAFPGQNGKIAYASYDGNDYEIYTIKPRGGGTFRVTNNDTLDTEPMWGNSSTVAPPSGH